MVTLKRCEYLIDIPMGVACDLILYPRDNVVCPLNLRKEKVTQLCYELVK